MHYGLCQRFLKENVLCVFSFCAVKNELVVYWNDLICLFYYWKRGFQYSNCLERSQSQCILSGSCKRMYVCLTTLRKSVTGWDTTVEKKCRLSYFYNWLYLCILYQWNFLYWRLKDTTKILEKMLFWPLWWSGLDLALWFLYSWPPERWLLIFTIF